MNNTLEDEANYFACSLLIPQKELAEDMKEPFRLVDSDRLKILAKKYDVPENAMLFRIMMYVSSNPKILRKN